MIAFTIVYIMWLIFIVFTNRPEVMPVIGMVYISTIYIGWKIDELKTPHREN